MFADISGFTNLTETLSKLGNEGAELIAFAINRYMELLVSGISKSGGDIFKFAGGNAYLSILDAIIVVWPPTTKDDILESYEDLRIICR
jgi:adenylate cyclase 10